MCGILAAFGLSGSREQIRRLALAQSRKLRHRGPDANSIYQTADGTAFLAHERLNIVDASDRGRQPFKIEREGGNIAWMMNSEIYNHKQLKRDHLADQDIPTSSDSAILGYWYHKRGEITNEMIDEMDGIFAAIVVDERTGDYVVARDPIGICPLYWGKGSDGSTWFASELKGLHDVCDTFDIFPPGHVYRSKTGVLERWYKPKWITEPDSIPTQPANLQLIHDTFVRAVTKRLMADAPLGVLLSGGLDSSLVAAVAARHMNEAEDFLGKGQKLHTFSIGLKGAPDLAAAQKVADFIGTEHHAFEFTAEEGIDALRDVIWHIESYEQLRASVPMYILARKIKALGYKVVLSGEGADEVYGGYLYFHKAPSPAEFHKETVRKTSRLHQWDVLRANKSTFAFGIEARVPFLDKKFLEVSMSVDPSEKMCDRGTKPDGVHPRMEKYLLRKAFDCPENPYLPDDVLWRQKEQFSDGVGYDWVDSLKAYADEVISDEMFAARAERFPEHTPVNKEYYLLRQIFEEHYPKKSALDTVPKGLSIACSTPEAVAWDPSWKNVHDISGRAVNFHDAATSYKIADADSPPALAAVGATNGTGKRESVTAKYRLGAPMQRPAPAPARFVARPRSRPAAAAVRHPAPRVPLL